MDMVRREKPLVDKIRKQRVKEFRAIIDDDLERGEFWLENTIRVFDELSCTPEKCVKCEVSLLRYSAFQWWNTLLSVVSREKITWEFFQKKFQKKYISQRLSKYARECISTEPIMCKRFEDGLNENIRLSVGIQELREFVVMVERAWKAEELVKEKRKEDNKS
ncbi:uncharacterized protein LOC108481735 [Gossypium arboreum]|uniref:uncharacterized protein LOC108481735 n=1 Tax=Gossypium arboreum TaxID=29729 RepID=UPI0008195268|nr:uncharacterized protein LOC108481735 [Gossypium arboreum]